MGQIAQSHRCAKSAIFKQLLRGIRSFQIRIPSKLHFERPCHSGIVAISLLLLFAAPSTSSAYNILFTTRTGTINAGEQLRLNLLSSWGHTFVFVEDSSTQAVYDAAIEITDVAYVTEESTSSSVSTKLSNACIGVVFEEPNIADELGFSTAQSVGTYNSQQIYINDVSHYITSPFAGTGVGSYTIFSAEQRLNELDRTNNVSVDADFHAWRPTDSNLGTLVTMETGAARYDAGTVPARRVMLPWGASQMTESDFATINANGELIMQRSVEWAASNNACYQLQKRSFLPDGTPLADGAQVAAGTEIKFLIYINNRGSTISDISIEDVLDPAFSYFGTTLQLDNSQPACASNNCDAAEEAAIFTAVAGTAYLSNNPLNDGASYNGTDTITVGRSIVPGNGQVDVAANSVMALLFSVTVN